MSFTWFLCTLMFGPPLLQSLGAKGRAELGGADAVIKGNGEFWVKIGQPDGWTATASVFFLLLVLVATFGHVVLY
jgi:hypothetical protein